MVEWESEEFLELLWGDREGWVDLPAKVGRYWIPFQVSWPADLVVSRRIDTSLRDREDLYYSVAQFSKKGRQIQHVMPSSWLWADLDEVRPQSGAQFGLMPTVAVESSPGRYQALWKLDRELQPKTLEKLNRGLSYMLGADKGGWDLTQVLRLPGTRNFKYDEAPRVKLMWVKQGLMYKPSYVWSKVKEYMPADELDGVVKITLPRKPIPRRARQMLFAKHDQVVEGERSSRLWELNCLLAEAGLDEDEIFELVVVSAWNKWAGVASGRERLARDVRKAVTHVRRRAVAKSRKARQPSKAKKGTLDRRRTAPVSVSRGSEAAARTPEVGDDDGTVSDTNGEATDQRLPWISYSSFMAMVMEEPKWLIQDIWTAGSHGLLGGEPKTSKTTIALAAALSVASGAPFLSKHPVGTVGPVLMVQEENAPWMMQDRLRKIAAEYGLISRGEARVRRTGEGALGRTAIDLDFPHDIPLRLLNNYGFDLGVEEHRDMLEAEVDEMRPVLVVLDPLYLMFGGADDNKSHEVRPFLKWIIGLRYTYGCAVMIVHHMNKAKAGFNQRSGQRILGSTLFHGFSDSAIYTTKMEDERRGWTKVQVETEFRNMEPQNPFSMAWHFDAPGTLGMQLELGTYDLEGQIHALVAASEGHGLTTVEISERLGVDKRTILGRVRGGDLGMQIHATKRGRGMTYLITANGGPASEDGDG